MNLSADFSQMLFAPTVTVQVIPVFNLQTSVVGAGAVTANPPNSPYASNSVVILTASAANNWVFDHWAGDATGNQNPLSLTINGPLSVQAVFIPTAYPLTAITPGGGSVTVNGQAIPPATYYPTGTVVTLAAAPSNGWSFICWQGDASGANNPLNVTISQTNSIQAIFGTAVSTDSGGGGSVELSQPNPIAFGTPLTLSAVPNPGQFFVTWSGAARGTASPTTITVTTANPSVDALFATLPSGTYSLNVVVNGSGTVTASPQQNYYNPGDTVTLNAVPNADSTFYGWSNDAAGTDNPLTVTVTTNMVIQANFDAPPSVDVSPLNLAVLAGSSAVLTANAAGLPPPTYQWFHNGAAFPGATTATLSLTNVTTSASGGYYVVVTNAYGSGTSAVATVTVLPPGSRSVSEAAYYRSGENDPGAADGHVGNATTVDIVSGLNLSSVAGFSTYSTNTGVRGSTLSLAVNGGGYNYPTPIITNAANWGLEAWVMTTTADNSPGGSIVLNGDFTAGNGLGLFQLGRTWNGLISGIAWLPGPTIVPNTWTHLAIVTSAGTTTFYVNGVATATGTAPNPATSGDFSIGYDLYHENAYSFQGLIDEVRAFTFAPGMFTTNSLLLTSVPPTPSVSILPAGGSIGASSGDAVVTWSVGNVQQASTLVGPWNTVTNATSPWLTPMVGPSQFFRATWP